MIIKGIFSETYGNITFAGSDVFIYVFLLISERHILCRHRVPACVDLSYIMKSRSEVTCEWMIDIDYCIF